MKSSDLWALLILSTMPEKPLELEGMWRSCTDVRGDGLLYVAEFKKNELVEDYYGFEGEGGNCEGRAIFHFKRMWDLKYNNFNFKIKYKESKYTYQPKEGAPNWYGRCQFRADEEEGASICRILEMPENHELQLKYEYSYLIKGDTLQTNFKGRRNYLKRVDYPTLFKFKNYLLDFYFSQNPSDNY